MLVEVCLHGEMGKKFGRKWNVAARNPSHALRIINANVGGSLLGWIRSKASKFTHYKVVCEYEDGTKETLSEENYELERGRIKRMRFTPVIEGAGGGKSGGIVQTIIGVVLIVVGIYTSNPALVMQGAMMVFGGISQLLAPKAKKGDRKTSHYFNGTTQTQEQGAPIQLVYGRCLVSGSPISVSMTVDQLITVPETLGYGPGAKDNGSNLNGSEATA